MNILVTGAKGMVRTALGNNDNLINIRKGKNQTRLELKIEEIYEYDFNLTPEELEAYSPKVDFVFNLAGVNRPEKRRLPKGKDKLFICKVKKKLYYTLIQCKEGEPREL